MTMKYRVEVPVKLVYEFDIDETSFYVPINRAIALGQEVVEKNLRPTHPKELAIGDIKAAKVENVVQSIKNNIIDEDDIS